MNDWTPSQIHHMLAQARAGETVYLVGAGGCGMSGLGHLLLDLDFTLAGSDLIVNDEIRGLRQRGATIYRGHSAAHVAAHKPLAVVYSSAIAPDNAELREAQRLGLPFIHRPLLLASLMRRQRGIGVAGMHGKTTTTGWLAYALEQLQRHPSYAVGALLAQLLPHARFSRPVPPEEPPWFVAEIDESDGSLSAFEPEHAVILNIDEEHLDYYSGLDHIERVFKAFADRTRHTVIFCADDRRLNRMLAPRPQAFSYGFSEHADYRIQQRSNHSQRFEIMYRGENLGEFAIGLIGQQNVSNAGAVIALMHQLRINLDELRPILQSFRGARRRQELVFQNAQFKVFDDYGHHPHEIIATLRALRAASRHRLLVAFQPHRFSRTQRLLGQFATCFQGADRLWLTDIYAASEPAIPGIDGAMLAAAVRQTGQDADYIPSLETLGLAVREAMQPGDTVLFLGAGDITQTAHWMARQLIEEAKSCGLHPTPSSINPGHSEDAGCYATLLSLISECTVRRRHEPMAKHTTLRVGGLADLYVEPVSETELARILQHCNHHEIACLVIGRGSNLLIMDAGFRGVVLCLAHPAFAHIAAEGSRLRCGAGARLRTIILEAKRHSLGGFEFLEGIPGSLGGALSVNAGAMGTSIFQIVESIRTMDHSGSIQDFAPSELQYSYRRCPSLREQVVLSAVLQGNPTDQETIVHTLAAFSEKRWNTQPAAPSAGCVFRNPPSIPAGKLIDELGFKGTRVGGALVSEVHANFIVNTGSATATDVLDLIRIIQDRARLQRGIELETEVVIVDSHDGTIPDTRSS